MKICFIGKYPPIEGGVSSNNYWLARGLAEKGHEINVVTNADEVEPAYRMLLESDDWPWYQPEFPQTGGRVRVFNTERFAQRTMSHIPVGNPFVTKLASLATNIVRNFQCDAIYAYYFEPYAIAAALVAHWTGRPLVVKHAGSDLDRLCRVPDLATAYTEMLRSADLVVTQPSLMPRFLAMGVSEEALCPDVPFPVPAHFSNPAVQPLEIDRLIIRSLRDPSSADTIVPDRFDSRVPVIGVYGKVGISKGTFDLIAALGQLSREGVPFNLVAMIGAVQGEQLIPSLKSSGILQHTYILPFLPSWKVPAFIRACTAICFLERDFPIAIHGPMVPREVLASGTCLLLSGEIAAKQVNSSDFRPGENLLTVEDPKDHRDLAEKLRFVATNPQRAQEIGARGSLIPQMRGSDSEFVAGWEQGFSRLPRKTHTNLNQSVKNGSNSDSAPYVRRLAPKLQTVLQAQCPELIGEFPAGFAETDPVAAGIHFCSFLVRQLESSRAAPTMAKLLDALRYQEARLQTSASTGDHDAPVFEVLDQLSGRPVSQQVAGSLRPVRSRSIRIRAFDFDVTPLFAQDVQLSERVQEELESLGEERMCVLFQRTANCAPKEFRINDATRELIERCDGSQTTAELLDSMCNDVADQTEEYRTRILGALDTLYKANVIVFGEKRPGWGWTGGMRFYSAEKPD